MTGAGWTSWGLPLKDPETMEKIEAPRHKTFKRSTRLRFLVNTGLAVEDGFDLAGVDPVEAFGARSEKNLQDDLHGEHNPDRMHEWVTEAIAEAAARDFAELSEGADAEVVE